MSAKPSAAEVINTYRRTADGYCACDACVRSLWAGYREACSQLTTARDEAADHAVKLTKVLNLVAQARKVSPSDRMTVMVGDLEHALGLRDQPARIRTGSNE